MKESGAKIIRVGGHNYNNPNTSQSEDDPIPDKPLGYASIVDAIRSQGCEPMITIPFRLSISSITQQELNTAVDNAKEITHLLNIVHKRNVKYFIIANEPGKDYKWYDNDNSTPQPTPSSDPTTFASYIKQYVEAISTAMKNIDPDIKIIAPELEYDISSIRAELLGTGTNSIAGTISTPGGTRYLVDYYSHHLYAGYSPNTISSRSDYIKEGYDQRTAYSISTLPSHMAAGG